MRYGCTATAYGKNRIAYFKLDRFHKHRIGIWRMECELLHVAIDAGRRAAVMHLWNSVFFKAGTPVHCTVFPTCVYRLSPLESKIFAANKLRLWT